MGDLHSLHEEESKNSVVPADGRNRGGEGTEFSKKNDAVVFWRIFETRPCELAVSLAV